MTASDELRRGFDVLLGRPLDTFDANAQYELWFWVDTELLPESDRVEALDLAQLVVGRPNVPSITHDRPALGEPWVRYAVDYAHTLFVYDKHDLVDAPAPLLSLLQQKHFALTGEELGGLVDRAGLDLAELLASCWYACRRAVTDGTLLDAMAAATLSASAPAGLMARGHYGELADKIRFEPRWESALAGIKNAALREHLLLSCVDIATARWAGSWFDPRRKADVWLEPVTRRGGEIIAIWHAGETQTSRAVVKIDRAAAPMVELARDDSVAFYVPSVAEIASPLVEQAVTKSAAVKAKPDKPPAKKRSKTKRR